MSIINKDAPLKVAHLMWAIGLVPTFIGFITWFALWYIKVEVVAKAISPLQTKADFKIWEKEEWKNWKEKEWTPHIKESTEASNKANREIGILLDRTDSRASNTNSIGRNNMGAGSPPME